LLRQERLSSRSNLRRFPLWCTSSNCSSHQVNRGLRVNCCFKLTFARRYTVYQARLAFTIPFANRTWPGANRRQHLFGHFLYERIPVQITLRARCANDSWGFDPVISAELCANCARTLRSEIRSVITRGFGSPYNERRFQLRTHKRTRQSRSLGSKNCKISPLRPHHQSFTRVDANLARARARGRL
jgi:hypothetical protein